MLNKTLINKINKPILITGASGFIGSNLTRLFVKNNVKVNIFLRKKNNWRINDIINKVNVTYLDIKNFKKVDSAVKKLKPKTIFHLATYGSYPFQDNLKKIKDTNLIGTINLLNVCEKVGFKKFINTGSSSEYGFKNKAMKETDILEPNSYYGLFKSAATLYCNYKAISKNLPIVNVRPFHVYGPYEEQTRFVPTLIINLLKNKCPPLVSPDISRDLIYIDDVVNFYILLAIKKNLNGEIYNLGSGKKITIREIFYKTKKLLNSKISPSWETMENLKFEQNIWYADMRKAKKNLNFNFQNSLNEGLRKSILWFKQNINLYKNFK